MAMEVQTGKEKMRLDINVKDGEGGRLAFRADPEANSRASSIKIPLVYIKFLAGVYIAR